MSQGKFEPNERLWHVRTRKGWSQARLAEEVGTSFEMVSRWERGTTVPSPYYRERLCAVLGQSAEELGLLRGLQEPLPPLPSPLLFLACSHADAEKAVVSQLKVAFEKRGIMLWSSRQFGRQAGAHPRKALQEVVCAAQAILIILSPEARSSRHVREALEMASMYQRPVCGVWIEGESWQACLPKEGSELVAWIDVRTAEDSARLEEIVAAVQRLEVGSQESKLTSLTAEAREATWQPRNPYKGLRAFRREDVADFFGRDRLIAELVDTLKGLLTEQQPDTSSGRLLALIGASGSGKSSVVMAGLLPQLERGALPNSEQWVYLEPMRPGEHPVEALALTLASHFPQRSVKSLREELNDEAACGLHRLASCLVRMPQQKVVLLIDQFEEVFTHTTSQWERESFIDLLITALTQPQGPIIVLLTLRADFYDRPMSYPRLYQLIETHHKAVLPMDLADLRTAIKGPATLPDVQLTFEETLVGDLLFEMQGQVGALPLLQFTLDQLFQRRSGSLLTLQAYQEMGGVKGALVKQAESTYAALPSEEHQRLAQALFLRLIDPGMGEQDTTRRRASLAELSLADSKQTALLQEVADAFITARLLTANEVAGATTIEVSHEALIREWPRLLDWLREGREDIDLQQAVSQDVVEWEQRGKPKDRLYRGSQLKEARAWAKRNIPSRNEVAFLHASGASRVRLLVSMIALLLITVSAMGGASWVLIHQSPDPTRVSNLEDNSKPGSLRYAVDEAPPKSTITFSASLRGTILLTSGDLNIAKDLIIRGPDKGILSISSGTSGHIMRVIQGVTVTIFGLTFKDSNNSNSITGFIDNQGTLTLSNSTISGNTASSSGGTYDTHGTLTLSNSSGGGGISNFGTLTLSNSTVSGNRAIGGGGIGNFGTLTLSNSTISGNTADVVGSGIYNTGTLILNNSTVSGNMTDGEGGGISNFGTLTLSNSTVSGNRAIGGGGGIDNEGTFTTTTTMNIMNSTISDNQAADVGGGILIRSFIQSNNLSTIVEGLIKANLTFSTIYGNTAHRGGDVAIEDLAFSPNGGNGKPSEQVSQVKIRNSIVAGDPTHLDSDIVGMFTSFGYNLFQDDSGATFDPATRMQHGTDKILSVNDLPKLFAGPVRLQDNGGPTRTYALAPGSPAIDKIPLAACLVNGITTDQRGVKRPQGAKCDIGAYEYVAAG